MIRYSKYHAWFCLFLVLLITLVQPLAVFADVMTSSNATASNANVFVPRKELLLSSASNADPYGIATMELTDEDYGVAPASSFGSVANTVTGGVALAYSYFNRDTETNHGVTTSATYENGRYKFNILVPSNCVIYRFSPVILNGGFPSPGTYNLSYDLSSDFSYDVTGFKLVNYTRPKNAAVSRVDLNPSYQTFSGDVYMSNYQINLTNIYSMDFEHSIDLNDGIRQVGGSFAINFTRVASSSSAPSTGISSSQSDIDFDVTNSLNEVASSLDSASQSLEYISTSQNLIIQGIDNVIMHISDQLYAFWDQLYNLIHEPTYARLGNILDAILNLDSVISDSLTVVSDSVDTMNQELQGKLQQTTDNITGGYDSSVLESENQQIQSAVDQYDQSEQAILDSVEGNIEDFTYPSFDDLPLGTLGALGFFGGLMQSIFEGMGAFNMIITFSLTLVFVLILIGYHRIRN